MRSNLAVTNVEYILKDTETVVSKTDLQGNITYVNADFISISGFSEEELIGAPQNIVRHPDMPVEAFADFWRTIKSGKAWTGMVKNRCKNGNFYWVEANAAPLIENGRVVGYTSVRVKPSRAQVMAAEQAYREVRKGGANFDIVEGSVVPRSFLRRFNLWSRLSMHARITASTAVMAAMFLGDLWLGISEGASEHMAAVAFSLVGLIVSLVSGYLLHRGIVAPLERARHDIDRMSAGDLSGKIEVTGNDELSSVLQGLRVLQTNVKLLVGQIKEATEVVGNGASEIAAGNADLSLRTESQASSLEETAASMDELTGTVKQNADNAGEANRLVAAAAKTAAEGGAAVSQVVGTMGSIRESSRKIVDIISVIDGIAFQTNILALNAAVEAARAGEQGRGFAVVATEVRNLAQRSASAAREIKTLITESVDQVEAGSTLVDHAGRTMALIVSSVEQVAGYMNDITVASREQSTGIEHVNQAVVQMENITQQNAAVVEEAAAAAERMQEQSVKLAQLIDSFKLVASAQRGAPAARQHDSAAVRARPALAS